MLRCNKCGYVFGGNFTTVTSLLECPLCYTRSNSIYSRADIADQKLQMWDEMLGYIKKYRELLHNHEDFEYEDESDKLGDLIERAELLK
jgi:hypothetical protein